MSTGLYDQNQAQYSPQSVSLWGLAAVCLLTMPGLLVLYGREFSGAMVMVLGLPYAPFELVLGVWLIVEGFQ